MTAPPKKPSRARMQRMLDRLRDRYGADTVNYDYLRAWLGNSNQTDEDFQCLAEWNAKQGRWSVARFCRLMCFTSQTQRHGIR